MPNWVMNHVIFTDEEALRKCLTVDNVDTDKLSFDFNLIKKMPEEIKNTESPNTNEEAERMKKKYRAANWYDWACKNWGTKWNANDTQLVTENTVAFQTAWSTPDAILAEASHKFHTTVCVDYADEDIGSNCGRYIISDGEIVAEYIGNQNFAEYVWGYRDDYKQSDLKEYEGK